MFFGHLSRAALLAVVPWRLAATAVLVPALPAAVMGLAAASLGIGMIAASVVVPGGEPFFDMLEYFAVLGYAAIIIGGAALGCLLVLALVCVAFVALHNRLQPPPRPPLLPRGGPDLRVLLLTPVCGLLPMGAWAMCHAVLWAGHADFDIVAPGGKSAWVGHWVFAVVGSPCLLPVILFGLLAWMGRESFRADQLLPAMAPDRLCRRCGYELAGLPRGIVCPECGEAESLAAQAPG